MKIKKSNHVCPVEKAGSLDTRIRRWLQNPRKLLGPYITEGMTVLDVGCGPGFFSVGMAQLVGESGTVIAADLQEGMLQKIREKIEGTELEDRIKLHKCEEEQIGLTDEVDFVLAFYMIHELTDTDKFFGEIAKILKTNGKMFIVEPPFHVSKKAFAKTIEKARNVGLFPVERPGLFFNKRVVLKKG